MVVSFFSSIRRHTRCALVTGVQTCALPIWSRPPTPYPRAKTRCQAERSRGQLPCGFSLRSNEPLVFGQGPKFILSARQGSRRARGYGKGERFNVIALKTQNHIGEDRDVSVVLLLVVEQILR